MGFLNDLASNQVTQTTTMPTWYDQAQQNVVNKAAAGAGAVPSLNQTVAGGAINQLSGDQNPFTQAQGTLNQIATGAANPWITGSDGQVTPNTNTAMGGLFQAQNQQLQQTMPNITAPVEGGNIASGNFGSLRGQTAVNKAMGDAQAKLFADQMQAAVQNQQTGVQAATGLGNVGSQGVTSMVNVGQAQQADPLLAASGLGKIVAGINTPTTVNSQTQLSPLNLAGTLASALGGSVAGVDKLLSSMNISGGLGGLIGGLFGGGDNTYPTADGGQVIKKSDGTTIVTNGQGQTSVFDKNGKPIGTTFPGGSLPTGSTGTGGGTGTGTAPKPGTTPVSTNPKPGATQTGNAPQPGNVPSSGGTYYNPVTGAPMNPGDYQDVPLAGGGNMTVNGSGGMSITDAEGNQFVYDANGNQVGAYGSDGEALPAGSNPVFNDTSGGNIDVGDTLGTNESVVEDPYGENSGGGGLGGLTNVAENETVEDPYSGGSGYDNSYDVAYNEPEYDYGYDSGYDSSYDVAYNEPEYDYGYDSGYDDSMWG